LVDTLGTWFRIEHSVYNLSILVGSNVIEGKKNPEGDISAKSVQEGVKG
jgi:hypothetical protein